MSDLAAVLTTMEPLAYVIKSNPALFTCSRCSKRVTREHVNVWQWKSHDHIRAQNTRTAQLCDVCAPPKVQANV